MIQFDDHIFQIGWYHQLCSDCSVETERWSLSVGWAGMMWLWFRNWQIFEYENSGWKWSCWVAFTGDDPIKNGVGSSCYPWTIRGGFLIVLRINASVRSACIQPSRYIKIYQDTLSTHWVFANCSWLTRSCLVGESSKICRNAWIFVSFHIMSDRITSHEIISMMEHGLGQIEHT